MAGLTYGDTVCLLTVENFVEGRISSLFRTNGLYILYVIRPSTAGVHGMNALVQI